MKKFRSFFAVVLVIVACTIILTGCVREAQVAPPSQTNTDITNANDTNSDKTDAVDANKNADTSKTNPKNEIPDKTVKDDKKTEISKPDKNTDKTAKIGDDWEVIIIYDNDGLVTEVYARNDDSFKKKSYSGYEGKDYNEVVDELVAAIKKEGYYVDEIDRERNSVTIEINNRYDPDDRYEDKFDRD